jgi:CheY-like chemotaxis protein
MAERVFVTVVGFTDEERHALNLLFRMSQEHATPFSLWDSHAPEPARVALVDGDAYKVMQEAEKPHGAGIPILWVGPNPPEYVWRSFIRPIRWPEVVQSLDELFPVDPTDVSFDLDLDEVDTQPPDTLPPDLEPSRRALIASPNLDDRLYLRAKLSLAGLPIADDAQTAPQVLELVRDRDYLVAIVDLSLGGMRGWDFLEELARGRHAIRKVIVTASKPTLGERWRAHRVGVRAFLAKPPDPLKLQKLLSQA